MSAIIYGIIILVIIANIPNIIAMTIGTLVGLIEFAVESAAGETDAEKSPYDDPPGGSVAYCLGPQAQGFFHGCRTEEELKARYRALMRIYHPDGVGGDAEAAKRINQEYEMLTAGRAYKA